MRDGSVAAARFSQPQGVALAADGNVYVADTGNHAIRCIYARNGSVGTVAGRGRDQGYRDGAALHSRFSSPVGIAVLDDCQGAFARYTGAAQGACMRVLVVADTNNHRIRLVVQTQPLMQQQAPANSSSSDSSGGPEFAAVHTLAGGGGATLRDDDLDPSGYADGTGAARFNSPMGVAVDAGGNVFVADTRNQLIRWITPAGAVSTLAGSVDITPYELPGCPSPCLKGQQGYADGSPALGAARFYFPYSVAIGPGAPYTLLVVDGDRLRMITRSDPDPSSPSPFAATLAAVAAGLPPPALAPASPSDIASLNAVVTLAGAVEGGDADGHGLSARFDKPRGVAMTPDGRVLLTDSARCRLRVVAPAVAVGVGASCATRGWELLAPPGCSGTDAPADALGRLNSPAAWETHWNAAAAALLGLAGNGSLAASGVQDATVPLTIGGLDGRGVPYCLGSPPPDRSLSSTNVTLGPRLGTGAGVLEADEDTGLGDEAIVSCPPGCGAAAPPGAVVGGAGYYGDASPVCAAAVHAGVMDDTVGGVIRVTFDKGFGPSAGVHSAGATDPGLAAAVLAGSLSNGVLSAPAPGLLRTMTLRLREPADVLTEVQTVAGAPAAPLDESCGYVDAFPPSAARFSGPFGLATLPLANATRPGGGAFIAVVADAQNNVIRGLTASCTRPCDNGGVCTGLEVCTCGAGWAGPDCTLPRCTSVSGGGCPANTICTAPDTCSCLPGYSNSTSSSGGGGSGAPSCSTPLCVQTCANGGNCAAPDTCACQPGWTDVNCSTPVCSQTCGNGGNCVAPNTCSCPAWWTGADCRTPVCPQGCTNGGTCVAPDTCSCPPSWSGYDCAQPVCHQGFFRPNPRPQSFSPSGPSLRPTFAAGFVPCDYTAWCTATGDFGCLQQQLSVTPIPTPLEPDLAGSAAGLGAVSPGSSGSCLAIELSLGASLVPFRVESGPGNVSAYYRNTPTAGYTLATASGGPAYGSAYPWASPGPAAPDRQVALVTYANVSQGVYVCANGGNCTGPDYCVCAPGWVGFDCRTPVCAQGFYFPPNYEGTSLYSNPRNPEQGQYVSSWRTLTQWESPDTPAGKFHAYMHDHPNFCSLPEDQNPHVGLPAAYELVNGHGDDTNEGWRRTGWWERVQTSAGLLVEWQYGNPAVMAPLFQRTCAGAAPGSSALAAADAQRKATDLQVGAVVAGGVDDTFAAFSPRVQYSFVAVNASGWWVEDAGGECVDWVVRGCFNSGVCVAPGTCQCAPGWEGDDCSLPLCPQATGVMRSLSPDQAPFTLLRGGVYAGMNVGDPGGGPPPALPGDSLIQYFTCPHAGNCTHPGVCTCEKGWTGPNCSTPLCAQECFNGGACIAPDTCQCVQFPSNLTDARGVPVFQKPDGEPQSSGWTGFDCGTPICVQAAAWVPDDDTGEDTISLVDTTNDGRSFQGGCGPGIGPYVPNGTRVSATFLCGVATWYQGVYDQTWANEDVQDSSTTDPSYMSLGRYVRINTPNYVRSQATRSDVAAGAASGATVWVQGPPIPGEGIYACYNDGSCVAPGVCNCPTGWVGLDCNTPLCAFASLSGNSSTGCLHSGVCADAATCVCPVVPSLLGQLYPDISPAAVTGWAGLRCSKPMCAQGTYNAACQRGDDAADDLGCWACPNGGTCVAPDTCSCPPSWTGYDCRTPVCTLHADRALVAELHTVDPETVEAFEHDPCGSSRLVSDGAGGQVPQGNCSRPDTCTCFCRTRAFQDASGAWSAVTWQDPLHRPLPAGTVYGHFECLDGFEGRLNSDGTFASCHLKIYLPTWVVRNTLNLVIAGSCLTFALLIAYAVVRRRMVVRTRQLKRNRRLARKEAEAAEAAAAATAAAGEGPEGAAAAAAAAQGADHDHAPQPPARGSMVRKRKAKGAFEFS